jgi:hypothetical protein
MLSKSIWDEALKIYETADYPMVKPMLNIELGALLRGVFRRELSEEGFLQAFKSRAENITRTRLKTLENYDNMREIKDVS